MYACIEGSPDPLDLAEQLFRLELDCELDTFHRSALSHRDVLGTDGLDRFRALASDRLHGLDPSSVSSETEWERRQLHGMLASVALAERNPDALIKATEGQWRSGSEYREIVTLLDATGRSEEAIAWARQGITELRGRPWETRELENTLASLLRAQGQTEEAINVYWDVFVSAPSLESYQRLIAEAQHHDREAECQHRAIEHLASDRGRAEPFIAILLYEGDGERGVGGRLRARLQRPDVDVTGRRPGGHPSARRHPHLRA